MSWGKQLQYIYDGDQTILDDVELDADGELPIPQKDEIVERKGKSWAVVEVLKLTAMDGRLPVYQVFLRTHSVK